MRRLNVYKLSLFIEALVFVVSAFGATWLTSFVNAPWWAYVIVAAIVMGMFAAVRWAHSEPQPMGLLAHNTLADKLADAAVSYGVTDLYNMQRLADQNRRNNDTALTINNAPHDVAGGELRSVLFIDWIATSLASRQTAVVRKGSVPGYPAGSILP
ncbi:hypothetical protein [Mesorhizobium sp. WSM1293]|uniref:hypothetical protein n=1 Tax=Mesorhizobium sp. WSM1293 TaxID=1040984 RepID=UPI000484770F|nr:hypothetical protein [Mesorhizobium sp. WSM1293]